MRKMKSKGFLPASEQQVGQQQTNHSQGAPESVLTRSSSENHRKDVFASRSIPV